MGHCKSAVSSSTSYKLSFHVPLLSNYSLQKTVVKRWNKLEETILKVICNRNNPRPLDRKFRSRWKQWEVTNIKWPWYWDMCVKDIYSHKGHPHVWWLTKEQIKRNKPTQKNFVSYYCAHYTSSSYSDNGAGSGDKCIKLSLESRL